MSVGSMSHSIYSRERFVRGRRMTKSPAAQTPEYPAPQRSPSRGRGVLVLVFRLLLLGVSGVTAWLIGVAVAQFYPAQTTEMPLLERFLRQTDSVWGDMGNLPRIWGGNDRSEPLVSPQPLPPALPTASPQPEVSPPPPSLSEAQRQELQSELSSLQSDLEALGDRTATIESQLGVSRPAAPLENRLRTIDEQLSPDSNPSADAAAPTSEVESPNVTAPVVTPQANERSPANMLMVTLPSDALFDRSPSSLRPESQIILDSIINDLQRYPGAAIRIAAHTDDRETPTQNRLLSFEQAQAVEAYLSAALGDQYHWLVVGYGQSRPVADNNSTASRQRNRRIEITIDPS